MITDLTPHWNDVWRQTSIRISGREAGIRRAGSSPRKIQSVRFPWGVLRRRIRCSTGPRRLRDAPGMRGSLRRAVLPAPVVFLGVALIAMALDHHVEFRMILDPARIAFQNRHLVGANLTCQNQNGCASAPLGVPVGCATGFSRVHGRPWLRLPAAIGRWGGVCGSGAFFFGAASRDGQQDEERDRCQFPHGFLLQWLSRDSAGHMIHPGYRLRMKINGSAGLDGHGHTVSAAQAQGYDSGVCPCGRAGSGW